MAKRKIEQSREEKKESQINEPKNWIRGAFVACNRVFQNQLKDAFLIKLSAINMIVPLDNENDDCLFYTYKDCCYYVGVSHHELRKAIDSFIFQSDIHWESYGY